MKREIICAILCGALLMGCGVKQKSTSRSMINKRGEVIQPVTSDYDAYSRAAAKMPVTLDRVSITGATYIKIKGDNIGIRMTDELKASHINNLQAPKNWYARTMDTLDRAVPVALKGWFGWLANDAFQYNQKMVAKDPVVVEQRFDTVTSHDTVTEIVEVVEQDNVVLVPDLQVIETTTNTDNSTTNNYYDEEVLP